MTTARAPDTTVLHVSGGLHYASEKAVVEHALGGRPGVVAVEANPVAQTATVTFDPEQTSIEDLRRWVEDCGFHCAGQSVLVQEAQNSKAPGQRLADRAAFWLVLVALVGGGLTFAIWYFVVGRDV